MALVLGDRWPVLARHKHAAEWLQIWADLGRAPRTIDTYARGLCEYLQRCERDSVDPLSANRAQLPAFVRELTSRPSQRGANVLVLDSGSGLANATLQQGLVAVRLFYDFLVEERPPYFQPTWPRALDAGAALWRPSAASRSTDGQAPVDPNGAAMA